MNLSKKSRKELTLDYLKEHRGNWVSGLELMNHWVGGLRAGARIYELRREGWRIETRPSKTSDVGEYRLIGWGDHDYAP